MSDTKFTAGPWMATDSGVGFIRGAEYAPVASVYGDDPECNPDERMAANCALIAAAPDMYEVLLSARQWLNGDKWRYDDDPVRRQCWQDQVDAIDAVIAKARGEKQ